MRPYRKFLPALLLLLCPMFAGCPAKNTDVAILQVACIALQAGFTAAGETSNATQSQTLCTTLTTDVQNFTPGSNSQDASQAATDLLNFLSAIAPNSKLDAEISIVVNAVVAIIADIPGATAPASSPAVQAHIAMASGGQPAPKTVAAFKAQWNAALAMNPVPGLQPLK